MNETCGSDPGANSRGHRGRAAPLRAGEGHRGGRRPCARCQPRQRLPPFSEQGFAAPGRGQTLARPLQRAAAEDRGRAGAGAGPAGALAAHAVCEQAQEIVRRPRDVRDLSGAGAGSLSGGEGAQGMPLRPGRAYSVRRREAGRVRDRRRQGDRRARCSTPLSASIIPRIPRNGAIRSSARGSTPCWRCCSGAWKRRASARPSFRFGLARARE